MTIEEHGKWFQSLPRKIQKQVTESEDLIWEIQAIQSQRISIGGIK